MLCLQFILNLIPFSLFVLEKDPWDQDSGKIDKRKVHDKTPNIALDRKCEQSRNE